MRHFVTLAIAITLLAGCASGVRPFLEVSVETYSYGERTPPQQEVPKQEVIIYQGGCVVCGSGVRSNGTGSVSGWGFASDGYPRRVNDRIR